MEFGIRRVVDLLIQLPVELADLLTILAFGLLVGHDRRGDLVVRGLR